MDGNSKRVLCVPMLATALWLLVASLQVNQILVIFLLIGWLLLALNFWIFQKDYKTINKVIFLGISIFRMLYLLPETEDIETEQNLISWFCYRMV